jgi:hypothetical protein
VIYPGEREGQYVGPFKSREDSVRFIELMGLCGEDWTGPGVVVVEGTLDPTTPPTDRHPMMRSQRPGSSRK